MTGLEYGLALAVATLFFLLCIAAVAAACCRQDLGFYRGLYEQWTRRASEYSAQAAELQDLVRSLKKTIEVRDAMIAELEAKVESLDAEADALCDMADESDDAEEKLKGRNLAMLVLMGKVTEMADIIASEFAVEAD